MKNTIEAINERLALLEARVDALEKRIERLEMELNHERTDKKTG